MTPTTVYSISNGSTTVEQSYQKPAVPTSRPPPNNSPSNYSTVRSSSMDPDYPSGQEMVPKSPGWLDRSIPSSGSTELTSYPTYPKNNIMVPLSSPRSPRRIVKKQSIQPITPIDVVDLSQVGSPVIKSPLTGDCPVEDDLLTRCCQHAHNTKSCRNCVYQSGESCAYCPSGTTIPEQVQDPGITDGRSSIRRTMETHIGIKAKEVAKNIYPQHDRSYYNKVQQLYTNDPTQAEINHQLGYHYDQQYGPSYGSLSSLIDDYQRGYYY